MRGGRRAAVSDTTHAEPETARSLAEPARNPKGPPICPVCESHLRRALYGARGHVLWACRGCTIRTVHPRPTGEDDFYDETYFRGGKGNCIGYGDYEGSDSRYAASVYRGMASKLAGLFPHRGRLLDFGCATGSLVREALGDGWAAVGVDASPYAVEEGRRRGLDLRLGPLPAKLERKSFDVITSLHTIEHLPDPAGDLRRLRAVARDDALLVVEVPNAGSLGARIRRERWAQFKPPEHINYLTPRSLAVLLRRTGWRPIEVRTFSMAHVAADGIAKGHITRRLAAAGASVAQAAGAVRALDALGLGGLLRAFATPERRPGG